MTHNGFPVSIFPLRRVDGPSVRAGKLPAAPLIERLQSAINSAIQGLLPAGCRVALLDFPDYENVGDSMIWLGQKAWLARAGHPVVYQSSVRTYVQKRLAASLGPNDVILLSGGGNFCDRYASHQALRERVLAEFPSHRIVQLPQTVNFSSEARLAQAAAALNRHRRFTLLARDQRSLSLARRHFNVESRLCPDMAFALGALLRRSRATTDVVVLRRQDQEACCETWNGGVPWPSVDWAQRPESLLERVHAKLRLQVGLRPNRLRPLFSFITSTFDRLAQDRLIRGRNMLTVGRVVITDRLHGHILSLLLSLPHVILNDRYDKIGDFYSTWTQASEITRLASSSSDAVSLARELLRAQNHPVGAC